ncbi:hypothetical protein GIB67_042373 [Kingdonia uniflora]|uniref:Uncharacterized protein n=1 Tax=Kingdonia uniflora TaxID=39325 RepID=A0A7J7N3K5_9MAGN|nr:hypothetical protein GIB67_029141 [Kingdonia uniflora]KAF6173790.1 hypothetical protein GIB67_042373 [Kingdonia uniflora]
MPFGSKNVPGWEYGVFKYPYNRSTGVLCGYKALEGISRLKQHCSVGYPKVARCPTRYTEDTNLLVEEKKNKRKTNLKEMKLIDMNEEHISGKEIFNRQEMDVKNVPRQNPDTLDEDVELKKVGSDTYGDVNMEAIIKSEDVVRAGGFGARDDLSSLLPVAIDSTDFEASLRDARDYEEPQGKINRPGLGWTGAKESKEH